MTNKKSHCVGIAALLFFISANVVAQSSLCPQPSKALRDTSQATSSASDRPWKLTEQRRVAILKTAFTSVAYYVPSSPVRILVLAHGYPWPDGTASDSELTTYIRADVQRWAAFAEENHVIVLAPAFGNSFLGYREMTGCVIDPDEFIDLLIDGPAGSLVPHFNGRFNLHGHSAGAQFAARYLVTHPSRLDQVILSAPSTYPLPNLTIPWPNGMAAATRDAFSGTTATGKAASRVAGALFTPNPSGWLTADSQVSVTVIVGSRDIEPRPAAFGFQADTRLGRAREWVNTMHQFAQTHGMTSTIRLVVVPNLEHDEIAMAFPARELFSKKWRSQVKP